MQLRKELIILNFRAPETTRGLALLQTAPNLPRRKFRFQGNVVMKLLRPENLCGKSANKPSTSCIHTALA